MVKKSIFFVLVSLLLTVGCVHAATVAEIKEITYDLTLDSYSLVNVVKNGDYIYGADSANGLRIFELQNDTLKDITPSDNEIYAGTFSPYYWTDLLTIDDNYLYAAFYTAGNSEGAVQGIRKYDLSNPAVPQLTDYVKVVSPYIYGLCVYDDLVLAAGPSEFLIYDKELTNCIKRSGLSMPSVIDGREIYADNGVLYYSCATTVAEGRERIVEVYDISAACESIKINGKFSDVSHDLKHLSTLNISNAIGTDENISVLHSIDVYDERLYVVGERGIAILDNKDKEKISLLSYYDRADLPGIDASSSYLRAFDIEKGVGYLSWYGGLISYKLDSAELKEHHASSVSTGDTRHTFISGNEICRATRIETQPIEICIFPDCHNGIDAINGISFEFEENCVRSKYTGCISGEGKWLIVALYKNNRFIDCKVTPVNLNATIHETTLESEWLSLADVDEEEVSQYKIKAYIWKYNLCPLSRERVIESDCIKIFEYTENALPGNAIGIHGGGFCEGASVILESIETANGIQELNREIDVLTVSESYISALLPKDIPEGIYNLRVRNGIFADDEIICINTPDAWQVMNTAGTEISPGFEFAVYGNGLDFTSGMQYNT